MAKCLFGRIRRARTRARGLLAGRADRANCSYEIATRSTRPGCVESNIAQHGMGLLV